MIKEYVKQTKGYHFIVRRGSYDNRLSAFQELYEEAHRDFSHLRPINVEVVKYGGDRYKRTWGIEFSLDADPPSQYVEISQVESTL